MAQELLAEFVTDLAPGDREPDRIRHPLVDYRFEIRAIGAAQGWTDDELLDSLDVYFESTEVEGVAAMRAGVAIQSSTSRGGPAASPEPRLVTIDPELASILEDGASATSEFETVEVDIAVDRSAVPEASTFQRALYAGMLAGEVTHADDIDAVRRAAGEEARAALAPLVDEVVRFVEEGGGIVEYIDEVGGVTRATMPVEPLRGIAFVDGVRFVALARLTVPDVGLWTPTYGWLLDGLELEDELQSVQFYQETPPIRGALDVAVVEPGGAQIYRSHPGFLDEASTQRVENCVPAGLSCTNPNPSPGDPHATAVAGILAGDTTLGQDPGTSDPDWRRRRSGVARSANVLGLSSASGFSSLIVARGIHLVNMSYGGQPPLVPHCQGSGPASQTVNSLYEAGVAVFKSAGNYGFSDPTKCTLSDPADAIGAFAVGGSGYDYWSYLWTYQEQSRGGTDGDGFRSIIGVQGYSYRGEAYDNDPGFLYFDPFGGTSAATPSVAGAAALYSEWMQRMGEADWSTPGRIYTALLLMGDRIDENGSTYRTSGYSNVTGAGRLRLRKFDPAGMDDPARFRIGNTCVAEGVSKTIDLNPSLKPLPAGVDTVKAVIWWYDRRHETAGELDDIRLYLESKQPGQPWLPLRGSVARDNKQMVYLDVHPTHDDPMRIRIHGFDVDFAALGCTSGTLVHYAYLWEDDARDDPDPEMDQVRWEQQP